MLGEAIIRALPEMRRQAESMMVDLCSVASADVAGAWDEETGRYADAPGAVLYSGPCRVRSPNAQEREVWAGDAAFVLSGAIVSLPVSSPDIPPGAVVTVTAAVHDVALVDKQLVVRGPHSQTHATARRLRCVEVSRA